MGSDVPQEKSTGVVALLAEEEGEEEGEGGREKEEGRNALMVAIPAKGSG